MKLKVLCDGLPNGAEVFIPIFAECLKWLSGKGGRQTTSRNPQFHGRAGR